MPQLVIGAPEQECDFDDGKPRPPNLPKVVEFDLVPTATGSVKVNTKTSHKSLGVFHHLTLLEGATVLQTQREQRDCWVAHPLVAGRNYKVTVEGATLNARGKFKISATAVAAATASTAAAAGMPAARGRALAAPAGAKKVTRKKTAKKAKRSARAKTAPRPKRASGKKSGGARKATRRRRSDR